MDQFAIRKEELEFLNKEYQSDRSSLVIIYGRRRLGKSFLIHEFLKDIKSSLYFDVLQRTELGNKKALQKLVSEFCKNELIENSSIDWEQLLSLFVNYETTDKKVLVIDEYQYLGMENPNFPLIFRHIWEKYLWRRILWLFFVDR